MKFLDTPDKLIIRTMDVNIMSHFWVSKNHSKLINTIKSLNIYIYIINIAYINIKKKLDTIGVYNVFFETL